MIQEKINECFASLDTERKNYFLQRAKSLKEKGITKDEIIIELLKKEQNKEYTKAKKLHAGMYDKMNYMCRCYMDSTARAALFYDKVPDIECLKNALLCVFEMADILHSRFVDNHIAPYWKVCDYTLDEILLVEESDDLKKSAYDFCVKPIEQGSHIQHEMALFINAENCALCVRWNHMVMDGGGHNQLMDDIFANYASFRKGVYDCISCKTGTREYSRVYDDMPKSMARKAKMQFANVGRREKSALPFTKKSKEDKNIIITKEIPDELFNAARVKGKTQKATVNDIFVAAYIRAFYALTNRSETESLGVSNAMDLRRYIKDLNSIGYTNHTTFMPCFVDCLGEDMSQTIAKVSQSTKEAKKDEFLGLHGLPLLNIGYSTMIYAQAEIVIKLFYNNANLAVSNIGIIGGQGSSFDSNEPIDAFASGGAKVKPCAMTTLLSVRGKGVLSMAIQGTDEDEKIVKRFFDLIEKEYIDYIK